MFHFNEYGCKIGKTALQKKRELQQIQNEKILAARKKEEAAYLQKKRKYDEVVSLNINDVDLTIAQLRALLNMKKRKTDKSFSSFKKIDLLCLWAEWKHRPNEAPQYNNELVESVHEASILDQSSAIEKETTVSDQGELRSILI